MRKDRDLVEWLPRIRISDFSVIHYEGPLYVGCGLASGLDKLRKKPVGLALLYSPPRNGKKLLTTILIRFLQNQILFKMYLEYGQPEHLCRIEDAESYLLHVTNLVEGRRS